MKHLGIDAVEIERFKNWHLYKKETLLRFFTKQELDYVFSCSQKSAERLQRVLLSKKAVFKSISSIISDSFLQPCATLKL